MQKLNSLIVLFSFLIISSLSYSETSYNEIDTYLKRIFEYSKTHDVKVLEELRNDIMVKNNRTLTNAYLLALYIASPEKYKQQYVEDFPVDYDGIMFDLYESIELKKLTPKFLYSFESIGVIAKEGNEKAIEKILQGSINSDGVVSELFCNILIQLFDKQPQKTLKMLSGLNKEQRQKEYSCFKLMDIEEFVSFKKKLKTIKPASKTEEILIKEIELYQ